MPRDIISRSRFEAVIELIDGAYSPNTVRAYYADMKEFIEYCEELALRALPAEPDTVAAFLESRIELNLSSSFIKRKYSTISIIHQLADLPDPTRAGRVRIAMLRVYRQLGRHFNQAYGITRPMLDKMLAVTDDDLRGARDRALLLIGYDSMRRRQELTSLRFEDIEYHEDRSVVLLRKSKTDQYGTGHWIHLGEEATWAMKEWFDMACIGDGFIVRGVLNNDVVTDQLSPCQVSRIFKRLTAEAGYDEEIVEQVSSNSLRVGAAQDMVNNGYTLVQIMQKGGWTKTDTVMRYVERTRPPGLICEDGEELPD